jgi:pyrimidine operon attenuation protein / uracil phosphoribosyltransferase
MRAQLLTPTQVDAKLRRIASQIHEQNFEAEELHLVGIMPRGILLAERIAEELTLLADRKVNCLSIEPKDDLELPSGTNLHKGIVILVDDVLYSGSTLAFAMAKLLAYEPKQIQVAVLIDRGHHRLPIDASYVGHSLATTLMQHISVELTDEGFSAYLLDSRN